MEANPPPTPERLAARRRPPAWPLLAIGAGLVLVWAALRDQAGEARDLGFSSVAEMQDMKRRRFASMQSYREVKAMSAQYFAQRCRAAAAVDYERECYGRRVVWKAVVENVGTAGATLAVLNDDGSAPHPAFRIASRSLGLVLEAQAIGQVVTFDAVVRDWDEPRPWIEAADVVSLEPDFRRLASMRGDPAGAAPVGGESGPEAAMRGL